MMKRIVRYGFAGLMAMSASLCATAGLQAQTPAGAVVEYFDPAGAQVVSSTATVETLKNEFFAFLEGPVWVPEGAGGYLLFSDMPANCIYKWQDGKLSVFLEKSGFTGADISTAGIEVNNGRFQVVVPGSNGLTLDAEGRLIIAQHGDRKLVRREKDGTMTVLADKFEGNLLNSPNDVVVKSDGSIYFTDPSAGLRGGDNSPLKELPFHGLFLLKNGQLKLLEMDPTGRAPNGLALSPDEKTLYLGLFRKMVAFDLRKDGTTANPRIIFDYDTVTKDPGGYDGIKVDTQGNIWGPGPGGVWAISPEGKPLLRVLIPEPPANLAFGDADGKGLYLTARRGLYKVRTLVPGIHPIPK